MAEYENQAYRAGAARADGQAIDQGLRAYMLRVYNYMVLGLIVTGLTSYGVFQLAFTTDPTVTGLQLQHSNFFLTQFGVTMFSPPLAYVLMFAPFAFSVFLSFRMGAFSWRAGLMLLMSFSFVMGLSMAAIFAVYVAADIVRVFFIAAIAFGGLSLWGYTTKTDLSPMRSFLIMGVWGLIGAAFINIFLLESSMLDMAISVIGILVFSGITVWQTQALKTIYFETGGTGELADRAAVIGAYTLYLAFIQIFLFLLRLVGNRQN